MQHAVCFSGNFRKALDVTSELIEYLQVFIGHTERQSNCAEGLSHVSVRL